jgi:outer membrane receptor for ferrienterochelin and colicin
MKQVKFVLCIFTSIFAFASFAQAQQEKREVVELKKMVVTATKTEKAIEDIPASVNLITKEDLEKSTANYIDDYLRYEAGVDVDRGKGGLSSPSTHVRLRGFSHSRAVVIMRDGVPISRAVCGGAKWNEIPVGIVDKVEMVKGASSSLYGSGAMGGVINIFTKDPAEKFKFGLQESYGSHDTWESEASLSGPLGESFGYVLDYNHLDTDGFKSYCGDEQVFRNASVDNARDSDNLFGKLVYELDDFSSLSLSHSYYDDETSLGRKYQNMDMERNRTILGYKTNRENFDITANLFYLDEVFDNYMDHKMYQSCNALAQTRHRPGKDAGGNLSVSFPLTENQIFTTGLDYRWAKMKDRIEGKFVKKTQSGFLFEDGKETGKGKQQQASMFVQDEISFDRLLLFLSARLDWYENYDGSHYKRTAWENLNDKYSSKDDWEFNPKIGAVYHLTDTTTLRGSIGRAFHMPYLYSLYATTECPPGKLNVGNPDLEAEHVIAYELGIDQKIGEKIKFRITGFYNDVEDWMEASFWKKEGGKNYNKWSNIDEVKTYGIELEAKYSPTPKFSLFANYTYLNSEVEEYKNPPAYTSDYYKGNQLIDQAEDKANFGLTYSDPKILTASLKCRYVGSRYDDLENTKKLESYFTGDLLLSRKITDFMEASFEINDLFDESWSEDDDWLASSGRTFMGKLKLMF